MADEVIYDRKLQRLWAQGNVAAAGSRRQGHARRRHEPRTTTCATPSSATRGARRFASTADRALSAPCRRLRRPACGRRRRTDVRASACRVVRSDRDRVVRPETCRSSASSRAVAGGTGLAERLVQLPCRGCDPAVVPASALLRPHANSNTLGRAPGAPQQASHRSDMVFERAVQQCSGPGGCHNRDRLPPDVPLLAYGLEPPSIRGGRGKGVLTGRQQSRGKAAMNQLNQRALAAEFVGTFMLMVVGAGRDVLRLRRIRWTPPASRGCAGRSAVTVMALAFAVGHISGAPFQPGRDAGADRRRPRRRRQRPWATSSRSAPARSPRARVFA